MPERRKPLRPPAGRPPASHPPAGRLLAGRSLAGRLRAARARIARIACGGLLTALLCGAPWTGPAVAQTSAQPAAAAAPGPQAAFPAITVVPVTVEPLVGRVIASGLVGAVETVEVQPRVSGVAVEAVLAEVGDRVAQGQVLARLSSAELELERSQLAAGRASAVAAIAQAKAQQVAAQASADEAQRVLERSQALRASGNLSQSQLDQAVAASAGAQAQVQVALEGLNAAQAQLALAEARLSDVELRLSRTEVKAPVAGEIVARAATVGAIAASGAAPMFTLIRDGALELKGDVSQQDLLKLAAGQKAGLRFAGVAAPLTGTVRLVEPQVDLTTRLGRVHILLDRPEAVRPGMFAEAAITVAEREGLAIPVSASASDGQRTTVLKVTEGVVRLTEIAPGIRDGGRLEVLSGLAAGDLVVARAGAFLRDGDRIRPVLQTAEAEAGRAGAAGAAGAAADAADAAAGAGQ